MPFFSSVERMVGWFNSVKRRAVELGLNLFSGVPLERFIGKGPLTRRGLKTGVGTGSGDFVKNFTIQLA